MLAGQAMLSAGGGAAAVVILQFWDAVAGAESRTLTVNKLVAAAVGMPVIAPVAPLRIKPAGSVPDVIVNAYGGVPPEAPATELYATLV